MKQFVSILILGLLLSLSGCIQTTPAPSLTPVAGTPVVATLVAATLTALVAPPNPTSTPSLKTATLPAALPSITPTGLPAATSLPTPTAPAAPTQPAATPTAQATPTAAPTLSPTPAAATPATPAAASAADCIDKAAFVADVTIPDETLLAEGTAFTKTWRIKNVGTCAWTAGYQIVFARGNILGGPPSSPLPPAAPGAQIDVSVNLEAPGEGGRYAGDWQFQSSAGRRFGVNSHGEDFIFVVIKVDWGPGINPTPTPSPVNCAYQARPNDDALLLQLINQARVANGAAPFTLQGQLTAAALAHSADMACNSYLDHSGSDHSTYSSRIRAAGYPAKSDSENIFAGGDAQAAFDWWMGSPIHRANILDKSMTQIGIATVNYSKSTFSTYYTLTFARP